MSSVARAWVSRITRLPLLDADGTQVGVVRDVVVVPASTTRPTRVAGFVVAMGKRSIFVHSQRVERLDRLGVHLRGGTVDLRRFGQKSGEVLVRGDLFGTPSSRGPIRDVAIAPRAGPLPGWQVDAVACGQRGRLSRKLSIVDWSEVRDEVARPDLPDDVHRLHDLHPADAALALRRLPDHLRFAVASALEDEQLADLLQELPEVEQAEIIGQLDRERAAEVLSEMEPDDAIDLLRQLTPTQREHLLSDLDEDEAQRLRGLLRYTEDTAGGLMTTAAIVVSPTSTVAEALARLRRRDLPAALAARVFVCEPPLSPPTGRYLGTISVQRLLREAPSRLAVDCLDPGRRVAPSSPDRQVAAVLARYDLVAVAVVDHAERLVGVVSVDDVLARLLESGVSP